nr:neurofilament medium polypeptide-like [Aegilops tauschii subsp. strangulata]
MSGFGSKGKWEASSVTEKDVKELRGAGYLPADIAHRLPNKGQVTPTPEPGERGWTAKAEQIKCPAPLPKDLATPQLTEMLAPTPYQAPEKKAKKKKGKETKSGPCHKGPADAMSGETEAPSSHEGDKEEEEEEEEYVESDSPRKGRKKKRAATEDPQGEAAKRGKMTLQDSSDSDAELVPKKPPRVKPLAESPPRDLPNTSLSEGSSLPPEMAESETPPRAPSPLTTDDTEASLLAATTQATEVSELNQKLKFADEEIDRVNKRFDETQAEVETLKGALAQAKKESKANKAAADKAAAELKTEQAARRQHEARVAEVEQELKDAIVRCEGLEEKASAQSSKLAKALQDAKAARVESRSAREEIHQAKQIAAVLPSPGGELDREVVLVAVSCAGASDASERPDEATDGAA